MTTLDEKARAIIDNVNDDFLSLSDEERKRICRFTSQQQIRTMYQMINRDRDMTTEAWREKQRKWLENCVNEHSKKWGDC